MIDVPKPIKLAWGIRREGRSLWTRNAVKEFQSEEKDGKETAEMNGVFGIPTDLR